MKTAFIIYGVFIIALVTVAVIWGMKTGQFSHQKEARNLPLEIDDSVDENENNNSV